MAQIKSRFAPYQMKHLLTLNKLVEQENKYTGQVQTVPVADITKHCAIIKKTLSQKYALVGTHLEGTLNVAIRHRKGIEKQQYQSATLDGVDYSVVDVSVDDDNYLSYDIITLKKESGHNG